MSQQRPIGVVTGASSGIGRAVARKLASNGFDLVLNARRAVELQLLVEELESDETVVLSVVGDAGDPATIGRIVTKVSELEGELEVAVVNAGRGLPGTVLTSDEAQWQELFHVNTLGALHQMRAFAIALLAGHECATPKRRDLVVLGSNVGRNVSPFNTVYGASKFAVHGASEGLRRELGPRGVRVTLVEPGVVRSNFQETAGYDPSWFDSYSHDIGPVLDPSDVADLVEFVVTRPPHIHLDSISIRPTRQDYP